MAHQLFPTHSIDEITDSLANELPGGAVFEAKNMSDSIFRQLLSIFSYETKRFEDMVLSFSTECDINNSTVFLSSWERMMGIPDHCFTGTGTLAERRRDVIVKLAGMNISTEAEYIALAAKFGYVITITPGTSEGGFPKKFPFIFFSNDKDRRFSVIIRIQGVSGGNRFPYTFPITFRQDIVSLLRCIYDRIKPANVKLIIRTES